MTSKCRRALTKRDWSSVVYVHLIKQTVHVQVCDGRISTLKNVAKFCLVHSSITIHVKGLEEKVNREQRWMICILSLYTVTPQWHALLSTYQLAITKGYGVQAGFFTLLLHRCALRNFHVTDSQTHVIRLRVIEGPKTRDQIAFCAFHSFSVEVKTNAGYIHATHA